MRIHALRHAFVLEAATGGESPSRATRFAGRTQALKAACHAQLADSPLRKASERVAASLKQTVNGWAVFEARADMVCAWHAWHLEATSCAD